MTIEDDLAHFTVRGAGATRPEHRFGFGEMFEFSQDKLGSLSYIFDIGIHGQATFQEQRLLSAKASELISLYWSEDGWWTVIILGAFLCLFFWLSHCPFPFCWVGLNQKCGKRSCHFVHDLTSGLVFGRYWELGTSFIFGLVLVQCNAVPSQMLRSVNPIKPRQTDAFLGNAHFLSELGGILLLELSACYIIMLC